MVAYQPCHQRRAAASISSESRLTHCKKVKPPFSRYPPKKTSRLLPIAQSNNTKIISLYCTQRTKPVDVFPLPTPGTSGSSAAAEKHRVLSTHATGRRDTSLRVIAVSARRAWWRRRGNADIVTTPESFAWMEGTARRCINPHIFRTSLSPKRFGFAR